MRNFRATGVHISGNESGSSGLGTMRGGAVRPGGAPIVSTSSENKSPTSPAHNQKSTKKQAKAGNKKEPQAKESESSGGKKGNLLKIKMAPAKTTFDKLERSRSRASLYGDGPSSTKQTIGLAPSEATKPTAVQSPPRSNACSII